MRQSLLITLTILMLSSKAFAQMPYTFSVYSQPYVPLDSATLIDSGFIWNSNTYFSAPIGFPFNIDTINCTAYFSQAGSISLTDTSFRTTSYFIMTNAALDDRGYTLDTVSHSPARYKLMGAPGHRIFKFEVFNAGFDQQLIDMSMMTDSVNLQVWYYEDSNVVELRYGPSLITSSDYFSPASVAGYAEDIDTNGTGMAYILGGNPASPTVQPVPTVGGIPTVSFMGLTSFPASGTVYRFGPYHPTLSVADISATANVTVFPTLCNNEVMIKYAGTEAQNYEVVSINGAHINIKGQANNGLTHIDITSLPAGMYLLQLHGSTGSNVYKFVKM